MTVSTEIKGIGLPRQAGAPPSAGDTTGRLPRPVSSFVGRAREVADLSRLLSTSRLVTLTGPSGMGKTRLAVEVATRLGPDYSGGAWLVALAPVVEPGLVPQAVGAVLGLPLEPGRDPTEALISHLRARRALIVLDSCEQVLDACATLTHRLLEGAGDVSVLATGQRMLGVVGETVVPVTPMSLPDPSARHGPAEAALGSEAVALFCHRATATNAQGFLLTDDVVPAVVAICCRLDGIPLAIELAAARTGVLTPAEIDERLQDRFGLLTGGAGTAPARHHTLRAALDRSYHLLSPAEATLLRRLSVFTGGSTLRAVERVCSGGAVARSDVLDLVSELVSRSLVIADTSGPRARYRLLETTRDYGRQRLADEGELDVLRARHGEWCLALAERAWHQLKVGDRQSTDTLESDLDNIRAALEWAAGRQDPERGLRLAVAMTPFWKIRGQFREGQAWLERGLRSTPGAPPALRARALWGLGMLAMLQGDVATATPALEESLALARAHGLRRAEALALSLLGFVSIFTQGSLSAMPLLEESVALARSEGDVTLLVNSLALYGRAHLFVGDVDAARQVFDECMERAGGEDGRCAEDALIGLGWAAVVAGEQRRAEELFGRALPRLRAAGERFETALVLSFLGELAWARGELAEARGLLEEGLASARAMGAPFPMVRCLSGLARVALSEGDLERARVLVGESCALARRSPLPYAHVRCLHVQGTVRRVLGDPDGAQVSFHDALATARDHCDNVGIAASLHRLAGLARAGGKDKLAGSLLAEALGLQTRIPDAGGLASSLEALAGIALAQGRNVHSARLFGAAQAIRDSSGSRRPPDEAATYEADVARLRTDLDAPDLEKAWHEGAGLSGPDAVGLATRGRGARDRPSLGWAALTPAEREAVELATAGLTNTEIAERLFVSTRTVQGRLSRVFFKLGVKSRRQLRLHPEE